MSIIEEKNHHRERQESFKEIPKVDGTWSEFLKRSGRKRGRFGVPSVREKKERLHGHTLHFVPSMTMGFAKLIELILSFLPIGIKYSSRTSIHRRPKG